jgi:hypothetical protein
MLLRPLHDQMFSFLKQTLSKVDGTFDQDMQRNRIKQWTKQSSQTIYSYDLSNATDRIPAVVQAACLYYGGFSTFIGSLL